MTPPPSLFQERLRQLLAAHPGEAETCSAALTMVPKKSLRVNTLKISVADFHILAEKKGWQLTPVPWEPTGFFIDREDMAIPLGKTLEHFLGLFYLQEAASMLPARVLQPTEKDIVLDMSAAPGSKATQIASAMQNMGLVIANDFSASRTKALATNVERQSCSNVALTTVNGKVLGDILPNTFDKILLDAPCSGEGTIYKTPDYFRRWSVDMIRKTAGLQKSLIAAAFQALRPNGTMVYSTCTYAPEENEGVVDFLLSYFPDNAELVEIDVKNKLFLQGITAWEDQSFSKELSKTVRLLPHRTGTGGFFVALIRKKYPTPGERSSIHHTRTEKVLGTKEKKQYTTFLEKQYSIDQTLFEPFIFTQIENNVWIKPEKYKVLWPYLKMDRCGTHLLTLNANGSWKLSTVGAWAFGNHAEKNSVVVEDAEQLAKMLRGENIALTDQQLRDVQKSSSDHIILLEQRGFALGMGLLQNGRTVKNQIPRHFLV